MQIILLEKIGKLGNLGDTVEVRSGYARNYLLPKGKATEATPENLKKLEARRAELEAKQAEILADATERGTKLNGITITMSVKAGTEGRLFGSVTNADIAEAVTNAGVKLDKQEVRIANGSIRNIGEHEVTLTLHPDVIVPIIVKIDAE